jgi:hypothetical protein
VRPRPVATPRRRALRALMEVRFRPLGNHPGPRPAPGRIDLLTSITPYANRRGGPRLAAIGVRGRSITSSRRMAPCGNWSNAGRGTPDAGSGPAPRISTTARSASSWSIPATSTVTANSPGATRRAGNIMPGDLGRHPISPARVPAIRTGCGRKQDRASASLGAA